MKIEKSIFWKTAEGIKKSWLLDPVYNIVFIVLAVLGLAASARIVQKTGILQIIEKIGTMANPTEEEINIMITELNNSINMMIIALIILLLYIVASYSVTQYFLYKRVYAKRFRKMTSWKYLLFNAVSIPAAVAAGIYILQMTKQSAAAIIVPLLI
jgi:hypothetical protein